MTPKMTITALLVILALSFYIKSSFGNEINGKPFKEFLCRLSEDLVSAIGAAFFLWLVSPSLLHSILKILIPILICHPMLSFASWWGSQWTSGHPPEE